MAVDFPHRQVQHMHITRNSNELVERKYNLAPHRKHEVIHDEKDIGVFTDYNL